MEQNNNTVKKICIALAAVVVVLLVTVAFLLGQRLGGKTPAAPAETGAQQELTSAGAFSPAGNESAAALPTQEGSALPAGEQQPADQTQQAGEGTSPASPSTAADAPRNLAISMSAGSLTFEEGSSFGVKFDDSVIRVSQDGDTVEIENKQSRPSASERRRMNVTVTVPTGYAFNDVDVEFGAGKLVVRTLRTATLDLELGAGSANFDNVYVTESAAIKEGAGELAIKDGSIANLRLQCGAGATRVVCALTGQSRIDAAVGAVDLEFKGREADYTVAFQMGLGACYYNNEKIAKSGSFGDGANRVDINGGFGVMRVNVG